MAPRPLYALVNMNIRKEVQLALQINSLLIQRIQSGF